MSNNRDNNTRNDEFDPSWIPVFIMLFVMWPIGLIMLYNKIKKSQDPEQKRRKPISWMSVGLCAIGAMFVFNASAMSGLFGLFALLGGAALFGYSRKMKGDERKFNKYANVIGSRPVVPISAIAAAMPCSYEDAKVDLQKMIDEGYFGQHAYIDSGRDWFISDSRVALSHLDELTKKFEKSRGTEATDDRREAPAAAQRPAKQEDEYQLKLNQIRALNDAIQDEDISAKIHRIEEVTGNIFELVKQNPSKRSEIHTFLNYYLPTTIKLLESYSVLEKQNVLGENIISSKANIEKMVDQLAYAFERQLDQMFEAEARDIGTDITVLERMMARDGLSDNPYSFPKQPSATQQRTGTGSAAAQQQQQE